MWLITICRDVGAFAAGAICLATKNAILSNLYRGRSTAYLGGLGNVFRGPSGWRAVHADGQVGRQIGGNRIR